ncbi:MAG: hypothetical protein IT547_06255 [Hyphomonadaceae bacterium]|nr:hypothetical protein [Hyphomonadaceae bacterium]
MTIAGVQTVSSANQAARKARTLAQIAIPLLFAGIVLPLIGALYLAFFEPQPGADSGTTALIVLVEAVPPLLLAWAMLGLTKVLVEYEAGRYLSLAASAALKRVGQGGLLALLLNVIAIPPLVAVLRGEPVFAALNPNIFDLCVLMFASTTLTVGYVLEDAAKHLKAENDQIV